MVRKMPSSEDFAIDPDHRDWTLPEFCARKRISKSTYLKLRKAGLGPEETTITLPGFNLTRITPEARRDWERKLAKLRQSKVAELESARRQAQVKAAGRLAAASPHHISKNRARPVQRRRRRKLENPSDATRLPRQEPAEQRCAPALAAHNRAADREQDDVTTSADDGEKAGGAEHRRRRPR
jgi:hypothetical protein